MNHKNSGAILLKSVSIVGLLAAGGFLLTGGAPRPATQDVPPTGVDCAVQLRNDIQSSGYYVQYMKGKLKSSGDKWLVLYDPTNPERGDVWIPRESVAWVITGKDAATYNGFKPDFSKPTKP